MTEQKATVISVTRRFITLRDDLGNEVMGTVSSKAMHVCIGDRVTFKPQSDTVVVTDVLESKHVLYRSNRGEKKKTGANIDHLFVVSAVGAVFNTEAIDRFLIASESEHIPVSILVNKKDLGTNEVEEFVNAYRKIGYDLKYISAKFGDGVDEVRALLADPKLSTVALTGVSGVGKSKLLNALIPDAGSKVGTVSDKTGQGRQTTTQPKAFIYERGNATSLLVIDYPGIQNFGLTHLDKDIVREAFPEIMKFGASCPFLDCSHLREQECAVRDALDKGEIADWRFRSYEKILDEIEKARPY